VGDCSQPDNQLLEELGTIYSQSNVRDRFNVCLLVDKSTHLIVPDITVERKDCPRFELVARSGELGVKRLYRLISLP
jgi:hypothetical protein